MALSVPRTSFARMMKEGSKHFRGTDEACLRNIEACTELAGTVRSAYGPNGMNKMVINHLEKLFVTNDAATIINELSVEHPAAKMLVLASQMQEQEVGDGTNFVLILAGALLEHAEELIRMGLTPTEISEGYDKAVRKALDILPDLVCEKLENRHDLKQVVRAIRPVIMSKQYGNDEFISELVANACIMVSPSGAKDFSVDNVRVCKILGGSVLNSTVMQGMVFKRGSETDLKLADKAKIAVFTCPFDVTQTDTKGTVMIKTAEELKNYSAGEEDVVEMHVKALAEAGIKVIVSGGKFGDMYIHFLNKYNLMGVRLTSKFDVRRLCRTVGATALPRISLPSPAEIGQCDQVYLDEVGETRVVVFKQDTQSSPVATVVIRGSTENLMDDIERAIDDGVNVYKSLVRDNRLLAGAGACEVELARQLEQFGSTCPGLEQYSIEKFAHALETVPKILAENCGAKSTEMLSLLYAAHQEGKKNVGFDNEADSGGVRDSVEAGIFDGFLTKYWGMKLAANAASTVLRVDQIIMAKAAGGPKPKQKPIDADDD